MRNKTTRKYARTGLARSALLIAACTFAGAATTRADDVGPTLPAGLDQVVYATRAFGPDGHYYANFGYYCFDPQQKVYSQGGGGLWRLDLRTGEVTALLQDDQGGIRDPVVHYDAQKVLFSYRQSGADHYHLYEIQLDGTGLRQLTDGPYDDIEPAYLPDGDIAFSSSRCHRWVMCWKTSVAILHRCDPDGGNIRPLSSNAAMENTPAVLPDGRLLYTRWEYVHRSQLCYHHLWTMNPDGTGVMTFYGNMHPTGKPYQLASQDGNVVRYDNVPGAVAMLGARPIPGTRKVVAIFSPGHGRTEHQGYVTIIDPRSGPDDPPSAQRIHSGGNWRDPQPVAADTFLVARGRELHLMDAQGRTRLLHQLRDASPEIMLHEPVPITVRSRERVIPCRRDPADATGTLVLADVTRGRNMEGVAPGEIKKLLVLEDLPGPFHNSPGFDGISLWGTFTLTRILGTVPVEPDGSAHFMAPAMRSLFFVALDEHDLSVQNMQSFVTLQPGETTSCVGCHEPRTTAPANPGHASLLALRRPASRIEPLAAVPEIVDFRRHVQPILEQHCVECHGPQRADGQLRLDRGRDIPSHGRGQVHSSYMALVNRLGEVADGRNAHGNRPPRSMGSSGSKLMSRFDGTHHDVRVSSDQLATIRCWLDAGAAANGTYAAMDGGSAERPSPLYIREMQRYGILPPTFDPAREPFDAYATDQAYWQSFWHRPPAAPTRQLGNHSPL
jgi:hypothetical protein